MKQIVKQPIVLLQILQEMAPDSSKNTLRSWLQAGRVTVDSRRAERANQLIQPGQEVAIGPRVSFLREKVRIVHEDDDIVVLEKPEGLLSVATDTEDRATVHSYLKRRYHQRRVYPVHRLDRETSGIMMFAYTEKARNLLKQQFEEHAVEKEYFAIVEGQMKKESGSWECFLEEDDFYYVKSTGDTHRGKRALTDYQVVQTEKNRTLLKLHPKTGRKNQLRVHCSESGYPIVGDKKYGAGTNPIKRMCLHAHKLSFVHPSSGRRLTFSVPLPEEFYKLLNISKLNK